MSPSISGEISEQTEILVDDNSIRENRRLSRSIPLQPLRSLQYSPSYTALNDDNRETSTPFGIDKTTLDKLVEGKDIELFRELGEVGGIAKDLETSLEHGIKDDLEDIALRKEAFGENTIQINLSKGNLCHFVWRVVLDKSILVLIACGAFSLGFGIAAEGRNGWDEGGTIFIGVSFGIFVLVIIDCWYYKIFAKLHTEILKEIKFDVVRNGLGQRIPISEIVVGDVVFLKAGDQVPAHGLLFEPHNSLQVDDEDQAAGVQGDLHDQRGGHYFLLSGTEVVKGYGHMLVTSVGKFNPKQKMMSKIISHDSERQKPLRLEAQLKALEKMRIQEAYATLLILSVVLLCVGAYNSSTCTTDGEEEDGMAKINNIVIIIVANITTLVSVTDPWELYLMLTCAYARKKLMADNIKAMVLKPSALNILGAATTICTNITGTLTENKKKVTKFWLAGKESVAALSSNDPYVKLVQEGIALYTTDFISSIALRSNFEISDSPTENAIHSWAVQDLNLNKRIEQLKGSHEILHTEAFSSKSKYSGVFTKRKEGNTIQVHWKGAAEVILSMCSSYYDASGIVRNLNENPPEILKLEKVIEDMGASSLMCIAFAYKEVTEKEFQDADKHEMIKDGFILLGFVGVSYLYRPGVKEAVTDLVNDAKVNIKITTGENKVAAEAIVKECGILLEEEEIIEGVVFRNLSPKERMKKVDKICLMARSSPKDKRLLIKCLRDKGHIVAVTGDSTNDAKLMKEADVGIHMGVPGTEKVSMESSDIVILNGNFASILQVMKWGRCIYSNIQKFIQFQMAVNISSVIGSSVGSLLTQEVPLTGAQFVWVSLFTDIFGCLAFATEKPGKKLSKNPPVEKTDFLVNNIMLRNILAQSLFQTAILFVLLYKGTSIFSIYDQVKLTFIFNSFVLCQIFNEFNARSLEKKNVFEGITSNKLFWWVIMGTFVLQILLVEILNIIADTEKLSLLQWVECIGIAFITLPFGLAARYIPVPDKHFFSYPVVARIRTFVDILSTSEGPY